MNKADMNLKKIKVKFNYFYIKTNIKRKIKITLKYILYTKGEKVWFELYIWFELLNKN